MLTGENGILTQATEAKKANIVGTEKEQIKLAMQSLKMKKQVDNVSTIVTTEELQNQLIADGAKNVTGIWKVFHKCLTFNRKIMYNN